MPSSADFDQLTSLLKTSGVEAMLDRLVSDLRAEKRYHELFEALKMQVRQRLGLPLFYADAGDNLDEAKRRVLEDGLIDACREVGLLLLAEGQVRQGWMYLRPVGDKAAAAAALAKVEQTDDNLEEIIEVALHEGVDPGRGFRLVLERYGTCNAITTFDSALRQHSKADQKISAGLLLRHLHHELLANVKADIARQEGAEPAGTTLKELVADREWMFGEHSYHIDTTHLASVTRISRPLDDPELLRLALDLTEYGRHLSAQFQFHGDEPFGEIYPSHGLFYAALLGQRVDEAIRYFRERAETVDVAEHGTIAIEVYVDLLARLGRHGEAIEEAIRLTPAEAQPQGYAPSLYDLSAKAGSYDRMLAYCRDRGDILGYVAGLVAANR